jgi:hypothetical protein
MIQNIIVALIVAASVVYAGYAVYRSVRPGNKPGSACGGCTGCELKNMKDSCESIGNQTILDLTKKSYPIRKAKV